LPPDACNTRHLCLFRLSLVGVERGAGVSTKIFFNQPLAWKPLYRLAVKSCPVCGRRDNCSGAHDEHGEVNFIYCRRPSLNRTGLVGKPGRDGGATFILKPRDSHVRTLAVPVFRPKPEATYYRVGADHCAGIYSTLIHSLLTMRDGHAARMTMRGLSDAEIERIGLRSAPRTDECEAIGDALSKYDLRGVPGFYRKGSRWLLRDLGCGVLIPVRDSHSRIRALQLRRDEGEPRYIWLSTPPDKWMDGASSGAPVHYANGHLLHESGELTITEGALKASVIAFLTGSPVLGVAGTSSFNSTFASDLCSEFPNLRTVYVAYDSDWQEKKEVRKALFRLTADLERAGFRVRVRTWPAHLGKGLDDYLLNCLSAEVAA
jgi:hypothetical protein